MGNICISNSTVEESKLKPVPEVSQLFEIRVHKAKDLPQADTIGSIDAYVKLVIKTANHEKIILRTSTKTGFNAKWKETLSTSDILAHGDAIIKVKVYDVDSFSKDDLVGKAVIELSKSSLPLKKHHVKLNLKDGKVPSDGADHSHIILSIVTIPGPTFLKKKLDHMLSQINAETQLFVKDNNYKLVVPIKQFLGLYAAVVYERKSDKSDTARGFDVDLYILETVESERHKRLGMFVITDKKLKTKYQLKRETWANGGSFGGLTVYSALKMNDVPLYKLYNPWAIRMGNTSQEYSRNVEQIVVEHGWSGTMTYDAARSVLTGVLFNDEEQEIFFEEGFGVLKVDYDPENMDFSYMQFEDKKFDDKDNLYFSDMTCEKAKKRTITNYNNREYKEVDKKFGAIVKLEDAPYGMLFREILVNVYKMSKDDSTIIPINELLCLFDQ
jgi:hypothetical protein